MKIDGKRTDNLERQMIRIAIFSALFVLSAVGFLGCLFYEYSNLDDWMVQWNRDMCKQFSIPCPNRRVGGGGGESRPMFAVFWVKYACSMLVGVTSSVWLFSGKTVVSWRLFIERLLGGGSGSGGGGAGGDGMGGIDRTCAGTALRAGGVGGNDLGGGTGGRGGGGDRTRGTAYV